MPAVNKVRIAVMMSSYNGQKYIQQQIESILNQEGVDPILFIRDDGSTDKTISIIEKYTSGERVYLIKGNNIGIGESFWELLKQVDGYDYYAWSDQDDIWDQDKLTTAVRMLIKEDNTTPLLYWCGNTLVDKNLNFLEANITKNPSLTLGHSLIESNAQGATIVFNQKLRDQAVTFTPRFKSLAILHDAWMHKLCLAIEGKVLYDPASHIKYREHGDNAVAKAPEKNGIIGKIKNAFKLNKRNYSSGVAKELLNGYSYQISSGAKVTISCMAFYRDSMRKRIKLLFSKNIKTGNRKKDIVFKINVLLGRA